MATIHGTVDGIEFDMNTDVLDDFDVLEMFANIQDGDVMQVPKLANALFGREQFASIKAQLADESGRAKSSVVVPFIFQALQEAANVQRGDVKN